MRSSSAPRHAPLYRWLAAAALSALVSLPLVTLGGRGAEAAAAGSPTVSAAPVATATSATAVTAASTSRVTKTYYGPDAQQWALVGRPAAAGKRPTVIFVHGGGWTGGGVSVWQKESAYWVAHGWVGVDVSYRLASSETATAQDGRNMLADMTAVLTEVRGLPYVDRSKIVVVGDSAGGHLAAWMAARHYGKVAGMILWSPVAAPVFAEQTAAAWDDADDCAQLCTQQRSLATRAVKLFGFSARTTNPLTYLSHYGRIPTWVAASTKEWVPYADNGAKLCKAAGDLCSSHVVTGTRHATKLRDVSPALVRSARRWAAKLTHTREF